MAPSKTRPPPPEHHPYIPLAHDQNDNVLPSSYSSQLPQRSTTILLTLLLLLLSSSLYVFWPSDPSLKIVRLKLKRVHVHTRPRVTIDLCMAVRIKVQNGDVYSMDYDALEVGVGYRGKRLGQVRFQQGHVRAFGSSYVDAEVEFNGVGVFSDVVLLLEDLAKGAVPFDTVTEIRGKLGVLVFHFPLQSLLSRADAKVKELRHSIDVLKPKVNVHVFIIIYGDVHIVINILSAVNKEKVMGQMVG